MNYPPPPQQHAEQCACRTVDLDGTRWDTDPEDWCPACQKAARINAAYHQANSAAYQRGLDYACGIYD